MPAEPRPGSWTNGYVAARTRTVSRCGRAISGRSESTDPAPVLEPEADGQRERETGRLLAVHPDDLKLGAASQRLHPGAVAGQVALPEGGHDQERRELVLAVADGDLLLATGGRLQLGLLRGGGQEAAPGALLLGRDLRGQRGLGLALRGREVHRLEDHRYGAPHARGG